MQNYKFSDKKIKEIINNKEQRVALAKKSHYWFFNIYLTHYIQYEFAPFHHKMFKLSEDHSINPLCIMAFRSCAKSTIFTLSYPIWSILGNPGKKFIIILGQTQRQARQLLANIKSELESNGLLKSDLGPFKEIEDEWGSYSIVLPWFDARITAVSMEQTIRGMRHHQFRPDLIIADDIEDVRNVKTKENRDKLEEWINSEIIPAGDIDTRIVFIGNLLHEDSVMMRLKSKIVSKQIDGQYIEIPLLDESNKIAWPGKFKDMSRIEKLKRRISNNIYWSREYLLKIISDSERVIHPDWIKYYSELPGTNSNNFRFTATGVDLAIAQTDKADYTAMVSGNIYGYGTDLKIYVLPNPVNKRLTQHETLETAKNLSKVLGGGNKTMLYIEDVGYQKAVVQELHRYHYPAEGIKVHGADKRSRLKLISHLVQNGTIVFPQTGCEDLITQLTGFGKEKYDDLADAFSLLINTIVNSDNKKKTCGVMFLTDDDKWHEYFV